MNKLLLCFVVVASELASVPVHAECRALSESKPDSDCVVMEWNDQRGIWFRMENAMQLKKEHDELREYKLQASSALAALSVRDDQDRLVRQAIQQMIEASKKSDELIGKMEKNQSELEKRNTSLQSKLDSPWHNPMVMIGVGAGIVVAGALTYSVVKPK